MLPGEKHLPPRLAPSGISGSRSPPGTINHREWHLMALPQAKNANRIQQTNLDIYNIYMTPSRSPLKKSKLEFYAPQIYFGISHSYISPIAIDTFKWHSVAPMGWIFANVVLKFLILIIVANHDHSLEMEIMLPGIVI